MRRTRSTRSLWVPPIVAVTLAAAGPMASAQGTAAQAVEEVIVTAQRREERLLDVPLAVQAISGEQLESTGVRNVSEVIQLIPGASEGRGNTAAIKSYQIRGVASFYGDSTVGYYLDEASYVIPNRNYAPVARTFDIERVEVLRGPQGTLYGLGAMGGTIRFISNDPDLGAFGARGGASGSDVSGGDESYTADLALNVPLVRDLLGVRLVGSYDRSGGFAESPSFPGDKNRDTITNFRGKVLYRPSDAVTLKALYQRNETEDHWGRNFITTDPAVLPTSDVRGRNEGVYDMYSAYAGIDLGAVLLESSTGYIDRTDNGLGPIVIGPPFFTNPLLRVTGLSDVFSQELRLVSQGSGAWQWVFGGIYLDATNEEDVRLTGDPPGPPPPGTTLRSEVSVYDSQSYAVFGEVSVELLEGRLKPLVGLRYFRDDRDFSTLNRITSGTFATSDTFDSVNPRFNLAYKPGENQLYYLNVAKGFRSGTFNTAAGVAASGGSAGPSVDPDEILSYEIGTKHSLLGGALLLEGAVYYYDWSDQQLNYTAAGGVQVIVNAGDTTGLGLEYGLSWRTPLNGLTLQASGNVNRTEFDRIRNAAAFAATPSIREGRQLASVPRSTHTLAAAFTRPLQDARLSAHAYGAFTYVGRLGDPGDTLGRLGDSHQLLRLRAGVSAERWGAYLFGENLLDDADPIWVSGSGSTRYAPRTIGLELTFDF